MRLTTSKPSSLRAAVTPSFRHEPSRNVRAKMRVESADMPVGTEAPDFTLPDPVQDKKVSLSEVKGSKATLFMVLSNHCPFVKILKPQIQKLVSEYQPKGVGAVAISASSIQTHPQDGPDKMAEDAREFGYTFPYLYDETQDTAKAYKAMCTPEFYVFDGDLKLQYHGQFDDARPSKDTEVTGKDVRAALDAVLEGKDVPQGRPSMGCSVKWHPGSQPDFVG